MFFAESSSGPRRLGSAGIIAAVLALILYLWWNGVVEVFILPSSSGDSRMPKGAGSVVVGILTTLFAAMVTWSYLYTALMPAGRTPWWFRRLHPTPAALRRVDEEEEQQRLARAAESGVPLMLARSRRRRVPWTDAQGVAHCRRECYEARPHRSHHDSISGVCVLKFDHFCPWIGNAIGLLNYKSFALFIAYSWLASAMVAVFGFELIFMPQADSTGRRPTLNPHVMISVVMCLSLSIALTLFMFMHASLIHRNKTTLEMGENMRSTAFQFPPAENWRQVFGSGGVAWFHSLLPFPSPDLIVSSKMGTSWAHTPTEARRRGWVDEWVRRDREARESAVRAPTRTRRRTGAAAVADAGRGAPSLLRGLRTGRPDDLYWWWDVEEMGSVFGAEDDASLHTPTPVSMDLSEVARREAEQQRHPHLAVREDRESGGVDLRDKAAAAPAAVAAVESREGASLLG